jgi:biotin-(acetyl-CoA carboxylase) ligase
MLGREIAREPLLADWLLALEAGVESAEKQRAPHLQWQKQLITLNQLVTVSGSSTQIAGIAEATDEWGRLLVRDQNGDLHKVAAGDVTLRDA